MDILRRNQRRRVEAAMEEDLEVQIKRMAKNLKFLDDDDEPSTSDDSGNGSDSEEEGSKVAQAQEPAVQVVEEPKLPELETNHEDLVMYGHPHMTVHPKLLQLPEIKEEVIGSYEHPALTRHDAFHMFHGRVYKARVLDQVNFLPCDLAESYVFAENWIRFRIEQIDRRNPVMNRIFIMYTHVLNSKFTPNVCREICVVTRYRDRPETLMYMEMHLAYRFDPCYESVLATGREAYRPIHHVRRYM